MEQRLPLMIACRNELNFAPVLPCTWNPKRFCIMNPGDDLKHWFFSDIDPSKPFTHLWFHKKYLAQNKEACKEYCERLRQLCAAAKQGKEKVKRQIVPSIDNLFSYSQIRHRRE